MDPLETSPTLEKQTIWKKLKRMPVGGYIAIFVTMGILALIVWGIISCIQSESDCDLGIFGALGVAFCISLFSSSLYVD